MSYLTNESTADAVRARLEVLRNYHRVEVHSCDERLRAAMAEYQRSAVAQGERSAA